VRETHAAEQLEQLITARFAPTAPAHTPDPDLSSRLHVATRLATLDLARESRGPAWLRARLQREAERSAPRPRPWVRRRPVLAAGVTLALVLALMAVFTPRSLAALVVPVVRVIESLRVGAHTRILRTAEKTAAEVAQTVAAHRQKLARGESWFINTPYGGFGGGVAQGESAVVQQTSSLEELRTLTLLDVPLPACRHRGQPLRFDHAQVAPGGIVLVYFGSGPGELLLMLAPVGSGRSVAYGRSVSRTTPDGQTIIESPELETEEVYDGDRPAVWDPDPFGRSSALRWEEGGVSYSLMGRSLTLDEAEAFFRAARPANAAP
jgi:hypothetical protein